MFLEQFFLTDPRLKDEVPIEYLSHQEHYEQSIRKSCLLYSKIKEWQEISGSSIIEIYKYVNILLFCTVILNVLQYFYV